MAQHKDVGACTFHCRVRVLLVRWESFGDNGTSGTLQCVVNEPASEHEPRTELYIAETLSQTHTQKEKLTLTSKNMRGFLF